MYGVVKMPTIGTVLQKRHDTGFVIDEVYLQGDDETQFWSEYNRAGQKEQSAKCNPRKIPIRQNLLAEYFVR
jgi:hypothetical protein